MTLTDRPEYGLGFRAMAALLPMVAIVRFAVPAAAQVNIEAMRRDTLPPGFSTTIGADFAARTGNVDLVQLGIVGRADFIARRTTVFLVGNTNIGLLDSTRFLSAGLLHLRQSYAVRPWLRPESFAQINYDHSRLLRVRGLVGAGVRVRLANSAHARVWAATGVMFEHERLDLPDSAVHPARVSVLRSSSYAALRLRAASNLVIASTTYVQPRVDRPEDVRVLENFALSVLVSRAFTIALSFDLRYDSRPPDGIESLDTALQSGIRVTF
jgi:Protein of unknown function, DUF481